MCASVRLRQYFLVKLLNKSNVFVESMWVWVCLISCKRACHVSCSGPEIPSLSTLHHSLQSILNFNEFLLIHTHTQILIPRKRACHVWTFKVNTARFRYSVSVSVIYMFCCNCLLIGTDDVNWWVVTWTLGKVFLKQKCWTMKQHCHIMKFVHENTRIMSESWKTVFRGTLMSSVYFIRKRE